MNSGEAEVNVGLIDTTKVRLSFRMQPSVKAHLLLVSKPCKGQLDLLSANFVSLPRSTTLQKARTSASLGVRQSRIRDAKASAHVNNPFYDCSPGIRQLAHDLVDTCGVDLIHGTSAHHIQASRANLRKGSACFLEPRLASC